MNTPNNQRSINTKDKIEKVFISLINTKNISKITVQEICREANINRKTFYAHYADVYDLTYQIEQNLSNQIGYIFSNEQTGQLPPANDSLISLFQFILEYQDFYRAYFNQIDAKHSTEMALTKSINRNINQQNPSPSLLAPNEVAYHYEFFKAGLNAILRLWLNTGCKESPVELVQIIQKEYSKRSE
jgi:AcrR family transcriptional regulator